MRTTAMFRCCEWGSQVSRLVMRVASTKGGRGADAASVPPTRGPRASRSWSLNRSLVFLTVRAPALLRMQWETRASDECTSSISSLFVILLPIDERGGHGFWHEECHLRLFFFGRRFRYCFCFLRRACCSAIASATLILSFPDSHAGLLLLSV